MKFLRVSAADDRYAAELADGPDPVPAVGEALIEVAASGVNRADLAQIAGRYPPPPGEPEILGLEVAGRLVESGESVCALLAGGGHAQRVAAPRGQIFRAPAGLDPAHAAGIPEAYLTAFVNLVVEAGLSSGGSLLVHAAASGVGIAAIQIARFLGARVAGTSRTAGKLPAIAAAGAELAIDTTRESFAEAIEHRWGRDAIDIVLDPVGAATLAGDVRVLRTGGRVVFLSTLSGARAELDIARLMGKRARIIGSTLRARPRAEKARLVTRFREEILPAFASGALSVAIDSVFPVARAAEAFERMKADRNVGKIVIDWRGVA